MTETDHPETDEAIGEKMDRIRGIIAQLEDSEVPLERAKDLRDEGKELLADVEAELDLGDASVIELE
jgi:exonuclease VII small subunit